MLSGFNLLQCLFVLLFLKSPNKTLAHIEDIILQIQGSLGFQTSLQKTNVLSEFPTENHRIYDIKMSLSLIFQKVVSLKACFI